MLSTNPARVCSVELTATSSTGWVQVFDAANLTETRSTLAEPGQATSGNTIYLDFGESGFVTGSGLGVDGSNFRAVIRWGP